MRRIILNFTLVLVILLNLFCWTVFSQEQAMIDVGSISARTGDIAEVPVVISGNTGFSNLAIEISYDSSALTLTEVKENPAVGASFTAAQGIESNPYNMQWDSAGNVDFNGQLAVLCFKISEGESGVFPIVVDYYKGRNGDNVPGEDINYDEDFEPIYFGFSSGVITVIDDVPEETSNPTDEPASTPKPTNTPTPKPTNAPTATPQSTDSPTAPPEDDIRISGEKIYIVSAETADVYIAGYDIYGRLTYVKGLEAPAGKAIEAKLPDAKVVKVMLWQKNQNIREAYVYEN